MNSYEILTAFLIDVKALHAMKERYKPDTPRGVAIAAACEAFDAHFETLDAFFEKTKASVDPALARELFPPEPPNPEHAVVTNRTTPKPRKK